MSNPLLLAVRRVWDGGLIDVDPRRLDGVRIDVWVDEREMTYGDVGLTLTRVVGFGRDAWFREAHGVLPQSCWSTKTRRQVVDQLVDLLDGMARELDLPRRPPPPVRRPKFRIGTRPIPKRLVMP